MEVIEAKLSTLKSQVMKDHNHIKEYKMFSISNQIKSKPHFVLHDTIKFDLIISTRNRLRYYEPLILLYILLIFWYI